MKEIRTVTVLLCRRPLFQHWSLVDVIQQKKLSFGDSCESYFAYSFASEILSYHILQNSYQWIRQRLQLVKQVAFAIVIFDLLLTPQVLRSRFRSEWTRGPQVHAYFSRGWH